MNIEGMTTGLCGLGVGPHGLGQKHGPSGRPQGVLWRAPQDLDRAVNPPFLFGHDESSCRIGAESAEGSWTTVRNRQRPCLVRATWRLTSGSLWRPFTTGARRVLDREGSRWESTFDIGRERSSLGSTNRPLVATDEERGPTWQQ